MSDTLATEKVECPCCKGAAVLAVYSTDGYTRIGNVACCYCVATGYINTEPQLQTWEEFRQRHPPDHAAQADIITNHVLNIPQAPEEPTFTLDERDAAFRSGYATATREFKAERIAALNRKLAKRKKAAALIRGRKAKSVPRAKSRRTKR